MSLDRFVTAQEGTYEQALAEVRAGYKESHWMWFVWPQLRGLGRSPKAEKYGLGGLAEAHAYLGHPVLGPRLTEISQALLAQPDVTAEEVLGTLDAMKLRSSATLFEAAGGDGIFLGLLDRFFEEERCDRTLELLAHGET